MNKKKLFMSVKIPDTNDIIPGFGLRELVITLVASGIGLIIGLIAYSISGSLPKGIVTGAVIVIGAVLLVIRDQCNESLLDKVGFMIAYFKAEKHYEYQYHDSLKAAVLKLGENNNDNE